MTRAEMPSKVGPFTSREGNSISMSNSISMDLTLASPSSSPCVCAAPVQVPVPVAVSSHLHLDLTLDFKCSSYSSLENRDRDRDSDRDIEPFIAIGGTDCVSRRDGPFSSMTTHTTAAPASEVASAVVVGSMPFFSPYNRNTVSDIKSINKSPKKVSKFFSKISINVRICPKSHLIVLYHCF
jgi:hypothetical protein